MMQIKLHVLKLNVIAVTHVLGIVVVAVANVVWLPLLFNLPIRFRTENCLDVYVHENSLYSYSTTIKRCF